MPGFTPCKSTSPGPRPLGLMVSQKEHCEDSKDRWGAREGSGKLARTVIRGIILLGFENEELFWKLSNFLRERAQECCIEGREG